MIVCFDATEIKWNDGKKQTPFESSAESGVDEVDGAGIRFSAHYFTMAHETFEALLASTGVPWESWYASPSIAAPLRHAEADYFRPLRGGHAYELELVVTGITEHSISLSCDFHDGEARGDRAHGARRIDKATGKNMLGLRNYPSPTPPSPVSRPGSGLERRIFPSGERGSRSTRRCARMRSNGMTFSLNDAIAPSSCPS